MSKPSDNNTNAMFSQTGGRNTELPLPVATTDLSGRVVIVVGANTGLGFECAKHFSRMNPGRLIIACRSQVKGMRAIEEIKQETGCTTDSVELRIIDLSSFASVQEFATKFIQEVGQLDILVTNAAMLPTKYERTVDGYEMGLQVNYLSPSLLTLLLLPTMIETAKTSPNRPRIVSVTSHMHSQTTLDDELKNVDSTASTILKYMSSEEYCNKEGIMERRYGDSKLFGVFFVLSLQSKTCLHSSSPSDIIINAVDPGRCVSQLVRSSTLPDDTKKTLEALAISDGYTTEEGSRALVYGAVGEVGNDSEDGLKGAHLRRGRKTKFGDFVVSEEGERLKEKIWGETLETLCGIDENIESIVEKFLHSNSILQARRT
ncbi:hypothetical protein D9758_015787 [Tetrapyrgos nigripes]|uniref:NAD(P)-binding protein n=1 Tax=Tetrapyrgos nigripes TaxID=182062 RepID=A0A8H5C3Z2_9AGAR|nr:hypothetical protein D9758_015787 [Tetrapyrgos nigripes]